MKVTVDKTLCSGHARCNAVDEDLFPLDDLGYVQLDDPEVPDGQEDLARGGAAACPERALGLLE